MNDWTPAERKQVFDKFYRLTAREVMDTTFSHAVFIPEHGPITHVIDAFLTVDHAWVVEGDVQLRHVTSIIVRKDLLRALEPAHSSYSQLSRMRHHSLAHGSGDCICCFAENRVLHPVAPDTSCKDILHVMGSKGILYVPVVEGEVLVGEVGVAQLLRAVQGLRANVPDLP